MTNHNGKTASNNFLCKHQADRLRTDSKAAGNKGSRCTTL